MLPIIVAIIAALPGTIFGVISYKKVSEIHVQINSRMDQLLALARTESGALGRAEGIQSERDKKGSKSQP